LVDAKYEEIADDEIEQHPVQHEFAGKRGRTAMSAEGE